MEKIKPTDTLTGNPSKMEARGEINTPEKQAFKLGDNVSVVTSEGISEWQFMKEEGDEVVLGRIVTGSDRIETKRFAKGDVKRAE